MILAHIDQSIGFQEFDQEIRRILGLDGRDEPSVKMGIAAFQTSPTKIYVAVVIPF